MPAHRPGRTVSRHTPRQIAARQCDLITFDQLIATGLTDSAISKQVRRGELRRLYRGVYTFTLAPLSREAMWLAATLACGPGAGISHYASGTHLGVSRFRSSRIDVVAPRKRILEGVRVHFCRTLAPQDITTHRGIPVTRFARLLIDFADELTPFQLANVLHEGAFKGFPIFLPEAPGRHNLATLGRAFELHHAGSAGTRSTAEDAFLRLGLPEPIVNTGFLGFEVDFRWPRQLVVVEVDGPPHGRASNRVIDADRDAALLEQGYAVLRFSDRAVQSDGRNVAARVLDALSVRPTP